MLHNSYHNCNQTLISSFTFLFFAGTEATEFSSREEFSHWAEQCREAHGGGLGVFSANMHRGHS